MITMMIIQVRIIGIIVDDHDDMVKTTYIDDHDDMIKVILTPMMITMVTRSSVGFCRFLVLQSLGHGK